MEMFGNLQEDLRVMIQGALREHQQNMKEAALSVAQKLEEARLNRVEQLRLALVPLLTKG